LATMNRPVRDKLAQLVPIIRGLLSDRTNDEDRPFRSVIVTSVTTPEAMGFAASPESVQKNNWPSGLPQSDAPPLLVQTTLLHSGEKTDELLKQHIQEKVDDYTTKHGCKPRIICLPGLGVLCLGLSAPAEDPPLKDKVAVVTGAAGAIGYGVCKALLANGCYLAGTDLPGQRLNDFAAELTAIAPGRVIGLAMDVTDERSVADALAEIICTWGGIDIAVINAGIAMVSHLKDMDLEAFRRLERVNVEGTLLTLSQLARHFIRQAIGGDIIVMSTKNVPSPGAGFGAYSATKAACHQLGRIASLELAPYDVRVNMVAPDAVFSEGGHKSGLWEQVGPDRMKARGLDEKGLQEYYRNRNLLRARVTGRHVANAVLFFATRQTPTTGATIPVDGGLPDATPR